MKYCFIVGTRKEVGAPIVFFRITSFLFGHPAPCFQFIEAFGRRIQHKSRAYVIQTCRVVDKIFFASRQLKTKHR